MLIKGAVKEVSSQPSIAEDGKFNKILLTKLFVKILYILEFIQKGRF